MDDKEADKVTVNIKSLNMMTEKADERLLVHDVECLDSGEYESAVDNIDGLAEIKRKLRDLTAGFIKNGGKVVRLGKIAIGFAFRIFVEVCRRFPNVSCGIILFLVLKTVMMGIPYVGPVLGPVLESLLLIVLVGAGLFKDTFNMVISAGRKTK